MSVGGEYGQVPGGLWLNRLGKWRVFFAGWFLGTRPDDDGPTRAYRDLIDARLVLRAEVTALTRILIDAGITTPERLQGAIENEARAYCEILSRSYPGFEAADDGMKIKMPDALMTTRRLGFPP